MSTYECCLCEEQVDLGEGAWDGRPVPQWGGLVVCKLCEVQHYSGVSIATHPDLPAQIEAAGGRVAPTTAGHITIPRRALT